MRSIRYLAALVAFSLCTAVSAPTASCRVLAHPGIETTTLQNQFPSGPKVQTFMGRVLSQNDVRFIFRDAASDGWYHLDDQDKAKAFFGKDVVITGTIDGLTGTIRMQSIRLRTAEDRLPDPPSPPEQPAEVKKETPVPVSLPAPGTGTSAVDVRRTAEAKPSPTPPTSTTPTTAVRIETAPVNTGLRPVPEPSRATVQPELSKIVVNLPEEAVGASSSVAIISRRSIAVPAGARSSAERNGNNVVVGKALMRTVPDYPYEAQQQRVEGTVKLHAVVGIDGSVRSVDAVSGPEPLIEAARMAIREWRFAPTKLDGRVVDVQDDVTLFFRLPN